MKAMRVNLKSDVESLGQTGALLQQPGDAVVVFRLRARWLAIDCPCGCREAIRINLDPGAGPAWRLYHSGSQITVYPSIWRDTGCESHFIIWRSRILLLEVPAELEEKELKQLIAMKLTHSLASYEELACAVDSDPWTVLFLCRALVAEGLAEEGMGPSRGLFRKR